MIGTKLDKYLIREEVGQGGMSVVYRGYDIEHDRDVAVKVLHPHLANRADYRARFHREARTVERLAHPNIPKIYDFSDDGSDLAYLVTEFVRGPTLREFVDEHFVEVPEIALMIGIGIGEALHHAHEEGVIHRDVKPENVMISPEGVPKLTDFGIAHLEDAERLTATATLLGSPAHMAPEHIEGKGLDRRADVFALGTVLYWMLTGNLPFTAPNPQALFKSILEGEYIPAARARPAVGDRISGIVDRAMQRQPDERYADANAMVTDMRAALAEVGLADDIEERLSAWFADSTAVEQATRKIVVEALSSLGDQMVADRRKAMALKYYDRVLALAPASPEIMSDVKRLLAEGHRIRWAKRAVGIASVGGLLAAAIGFLVTRPSAPEPSPPTVATKVASTPAPTPAATPPVVAPPRSAAPAPTTIALETPGRAAPTPAPAPGRPSGRVQPPKVQRPAVAGLQPGKEVRVAAASGLSGPRKTSAGPIYIPIKAFPFADVYVDGKKVAQHPPAQRILITPGKHEVSFRKLGKRKDFSIDVSPDGVGLKPLQFWWPATITVEGAPGHFLQVQGKDLGTTDRPRDFPMQRDVVRGARVVVIDPTSGPVYENTFDLRAGGQVPIVVPR